MYKVQRPKPAEPETTLVFRPWTLGWLQTTCRAGAIVLLVGFFFDGGLFKLATSSMFWILLELGRIEPFDQVRDADHRIGAKPSSPAKLAEAKFGAPRIETPRQRSRLETWLRRSAWTVGVVALLQTVVLLGIPFLPAGNATLTVARRWLVPSKAVGDLDFLASEKAALPGIKLKILLQHASLANYNRELINWKFDNQIYREYVLAPAISPERDGNLDWRRSLWEYFYPLIRKEIDPESAEQIVVKYLRDRITIVSMGTTTIEEMWQQRKADTKGFEALKVAAFRSTGIPARLNGDGRAESWSYGEWRTTWGANGKTLHRFAHVLCSLKAPIE